MSSFTLIVLAC